jgi:hypothetical protein
MIQIEHAPHHEPQSPIDLVVVEIIFGCLFDAFQHTSEVAGTGTSAGDDTLPVKKTRALPLKRMLAPK